MLPTLVTRDIDEGLKAYIKEDFPIASPGFRGKDGKNIVEAYLDRPESLEKGPWVDVKLPFRTADENEALPFTRLGKAVLGDFRPYRHQLATFWRLAWKSPRSTIVATGTGSGKTECFLYPILDYCMASGAKGIKAILIYPMNALASDQSRRLAKLLSKINKGRKRPIRAGTYTGDSREPVSQMTEDSTITDRYAMRRDPPDILLTNYKMLDYLLLRPEDQPLWDKTDPKALKYLVADELHTYGGAQGTDLACLVRRLRARLDLKPDELACVGTSATIGGESGVGALRRFAEDIFGTPFDSDSIILEDRLKPDEFLDSFGEYHPEGGWPGNAIKKLDRSHGEKAYLAKVAKLWFGYAANEIGFNDASDSLKAREALARHLPNLEAFRRFVEDARGVTEIRALAERWEKEIPELKGIEQQRRDRIDLIGRMIESLVALISASRLPSLGEGKDTGRPFLQVRSQVWVRTLQRAVATVSRHPELRLAGELPSLRSPLAMPLVGCRECEQAAWGGIADLSRGDAKVKPDLKLFYESWFTRRPGTRLFYPVTDPGTFSRFRAELWLLDPGTGELSGLPETAGPDDYFTREGVLKDDPADSRVLVRVPPIDQNKNGIRCPVCGAFNSLRIFGFGNATLTSAAVAQVNASRFNSDHKIIAFSDSVQDASQRAGFISARNYQATVRQAVMACLSSKDKEGSVQFSRLLNELPDFWFKKFQQNHSGQYADLAAKADFIATFTPDDMKWRFAWEDFERTIGRLTQDDAFSEYLNLGEEERKRIRVFYGRIRERLVWEASTEFGHRSVLGRTLLRTNSAALFPDPIYLGQAKNAFAKDMERLGLEGATPEKCLQFLAGLLDIMRESGSFDLSEVLSAKTAWRDFSAFLTDGDDYRHFNMSTVLPNYGKWFPPPTGLALTASAADHFTSSILNPAGTRDSRVTAWVRTCFEPKDGPLLSPAEIQDISLAAMKALEQSGLAKRVPRVRNDEVLWVSPAESWNVTRQLALFRCTECGKVWRAAAGTETLDGSPCRSPGCRGTLERIPERPASTAYASDPFRVNAREHTALVDGDTRASIEESFGKSSETWSVNLLSATPTLEMGIDIGKLSTVIQCTLPPAESNYLQRIGRAGRHDGNALALTLLEHDPHSRYFWERPDEMLMGEVESPGVFLGAVSVLERQLTAFALTEWTRGEGKGKRFPKKLGQAISMMASGTTNEFPSAFFAFLDRNADALFEKFTSLFVTDGKPSLTPEELSYLRKFLSGSGDLGGRLSLAARIRDFLMRQSDDRAAHVRERDELKKRERELERRPKDPATLVELEDVRTSRAAKDDFIRRGYTEKDFFNFCTDEGLLPNYAFPEAGITVDSVIQKRRNPSEKNEEEYPKQKYLPYDFSFSRTAATAIGELAPNCTFFVNGYKMHVDQVVLQEGTFEEWRLCDQCSYAERVEPGKEPAKTCPRCGSTAWSDTGRVHTMIRLRQVVAHADIRLDRIHDDSDGRHTDLQAKLTTVDMDPKCVTSSWMLPKANGAFGFEFLKTSTIREINFGPAEEKDEANPLRVAGKEMAHRGFQICSKCGMVRKRGENVKQHALGCPYRGKSEEEQKDAWKGGLFLFRDFRSEAIRIRLPVNLEVDPKESRIAVESLKAALSLGLRRHFKGDVSHLRILFQEEPGKDPDSPRIPCLVIYDTVPGGTGYLKDLTRLSESTGKPENMVAMLHEAYDAVAHCSCASDPTKDGCYQCVYQYLDFGSRSYISRKKAEQILGRIISEPASSYVEKNLRSTEYHGESELEELFAKKLGQVPGFSLSFRPVPDCRENWQLRVELTDDARANWKRATGTDPGESFIWSLRAQQEVGRTDGSEKLSRPDFTFRPMREKLSVRHPELVSRVFTDGWRYHAGILSDDTMKREAILKLGERVWSIAWEDVRSFGEEASQDSALPESVLVNRDGGGYVKNVWHRAFPNARGTEPEARQSAKELLLSGRSNFEWLIGWLRDPFGFETRMQDAVYYGFLTSLGRGKNALLLQKDVPAPIFREDFGLGTKRAFVRGEAGDGGITLAWSPVQRKKETKLAGALLIDDSPFEAKDGVLADEGLHRRWARFWRIANAVQFADYCWIVTSSNHNDAFFDGVPKPGKTIEERLRGTYDAEWADILDDIREDEYLAPLRPIAEAASAAGLPPPADYGCDGWGGETVCDGTGICWKADSGALAYVFPENTLYKGAGDAAKNEENVVLAGDGAGWIEELRAKLGI